MGGDVLEHELRDLITDTTEKKFSAFRNCSDGDIRGEGKKPRTKLRQK